MSHFLIFKILCQLLLQREMLVRKLKMAFCWTRATTRRPRPPRCQEKERKKTLPGGRTKEEERKMRIVINSVQPLRRTKSISFVFSIFIMSGLPQDAESKDGIDRLIRRFFRLDVGVAIDDWRWDEKGGRWWRDFGDGRVFHFCGHFLVLAVFQGCARECLWRRRENSANSVAQ